VPKGLAEGIVLPMGWGLMEVGEKGLRTKTAAIARKKIPDPGRMFVAALARAASKEVSEIRKDWVPASSIAEALEERYRAGAAHAPHEAKFKIDELHKKVAGARPILAILGIDIDTTDWEYQMDAATGKREALALKVGRAILGKFINGGVKDACRLIDRSVIELRRVEKDLVGLLADTENEA
jgi:hypothetical protein